MIARMLNPVGRGGDVIMLWDLANDEVTDAGGAERNQRSVDRLLGRLSVISLFHLRIAGPRFGVTPA